MHQIFYKQIGALSICTAGGVRGCIGWRFAYVTFHPDLHRSHDIVFQRDRNASYRRNAA